MSTRILLVEDDAFVARAAKRRLERDGYHVDTKHDGAEGLEAAQNGDYDLILLDHMLPGHSGLHILSEIGGSEPPVVMVSASSDLSVVVEALRMGATDYVIKETDGSFLDLLPEVVGRALAHVRLVKAKEEADRHIAEQAAVIQGVLDHMDPGVTLFSDDLTLKSFNDRFLALLNVPHDLAHRPAVLADIAAHLAATGRLLDEEEEVAPADYAKVFQQPTTFRCEFETEAGTVVEISGGPMPGGGHIAAYYDITQRKHMENELRRLATTDPLTGVNNRRRFDDVTAREVARCKRYGHALCVMMIDADHFKSINDTHGHDVGDDVLVALAETCTQTLRDVDIVGRYGGEEFVATLPETDLAVGLEAAERLRQEIAQLRINVPGGPPISVTVSIGIAAMGEDLNTPESLLVAADAALYEAKEAGRNQVMQSRSR